MPRYLVERTFHDGLQIPLDSRGARACVGVVAANAKHGVTWLHSYVSDDFRKTYCIYDGPSFEAIRAAARDSNLPLDTITQVSVLEPYFYHPTD
jgi:Protein of unknown function (DUF4242)